MKANWNKSNESPLPMQNGAARKAALLLATCIAMVGSACAETVLWNARADLGSCNRIKYYTDDFGFEWPTNESVGQTIDAEIYMAGTLDEFLENRVRSCALQGVAAAGASGLMTQGTAIWPTFAATFNACISSVDVTDIAADNLGLRVETHCNW